MSQTSNPSLDLKKIITPSPNASSLQQFGNIPVSLYTGTSNISVPLYDIKEGALKLSISLGYNTGGTKVADIASSVGLGWNLNAGGTISRTVFGLADEGSIGLPYTIANNPTLGQIKSSLLGTGASNLTDMQPDIFYFNFNGKSGKFIITKTSLISITPHQNLKIQAYRNDGSVQDPPFLGIGPLQFRITDEDGIIYEFKDYETNKTIGFDGNNLSNDPPANSPGNSQIAITAWYLSRMISPTKDTIAFVYTDYTQNYDLSSSEQRYILLSGNNTNAQPTLVKNVTYCQNQNKRLQKILFSNGSVAFSNLQSRKDLLGDSELNKIAIYKKDGTLLKAYSLNYKYANGTALSDGTSLTNASYDNYYTSYYSYVHGQSGASTASLRRLMLIGVSELSSTGDPTGRKYTFDYNLDYGLPSRFSKSRDYWGYYNGSTDNEDNFLSYQLSGQDRSNPNNYLILGKDPDSIYCRQNSLSKITYPTGGSTQIKYELHKAYMGKGVLPPDITAQSCQMVIDYANYHYLGYTDTVINNIACLYKSFLINTTGTTVNISMSGMPYQGQGINFPTKYEIYDSTSQKVVAMADIYNSNQVINTTYNTVSCKLSKYLPYGPYKLIFTPLASDIGNSNYHNTYGANPVCVVDGWSNVVNHKDSIYINRNIGGLRTKATVDYDPVSNQSIQKLYNYNLINDTISAGELVSGASYVYNYNQIYNWITHSTDGGIPDYSNVELNKYTVINSESNYALSTTQGSYVGYSTVTVTESDPLTGLINGKSEYHYTSPKQFPDYYGIVPGMLYYSSTTPPNNQSYSPTPGPVNPYPYVPADNRDWQRGLLTQKIDYKYVSNQFTPIHYENNLYSVPTYTDTIIGITTRYFQQLIPSITDTIAYDILTQSMLPYQEIYAAKQYSYLSGYVTLLSKSETSAENGANLTTTSFYTYNDAPSYFLPTSDSSVNSKGEITTTRFKYPFDYTIIGTPNNDLATGIQNLQNNHISTPVVEQTTKRTNNDGSNLRTISSLLTSFKPSIPLPDIIYKTEFSTPVTDFQLTTISSSGSMLDTRYKPQIQFDSYDGRGNLLQQHKVNDINKSYIWDYSNTLPVGEVTNTSSSDIAYTSFEADGTGNWTFSGTTTVESAAPPTGNNSYNLAGGSVSKTGLTTTTAYTVSYWTKNAAAYTITGTISGYPIKGRSFNGWTYYEHKVTGVTSVTLSGSGYIDELRLYPANAQMTTYTYTPLVGMSSQCDVNNRMTYYQYDGLQRLKVIRDQNWNILKRYSYVYQTPASQTNNVSISCTNQPGYANYYVSFTGTTGESPTFTVPLTGGTLGSIPAGTYNITFTSSPPIAGSIFKVGCSPVLTATGTTATFSNVAVTTSTCNTITISAP